MSLINTPKADVAIFWKGRLVNTCLPCKKNPYGIPHASGKNLFFKIGDTTGKEDYISQGTPVDSAFRVLPDGW